MFVCTIGQNKECSSDKHQQTLIKKKALAVVQNHIFFIVITDIIHS